MTVHRFVVPVKGVSTFCTFLDGRLRPENPLPAVGHGEHAIDDEFGWVAWVSEDGKAIGRTHLDAIDGEGGFAPLALPEGYEAACLLFHRQVLFVGGRCGTEVIGAFDLAAAGPRWTPLTVPPQFRQGGKRIDDLLLDGDRLIAVDNIVFPKYLLLYDAADPRAPRLTGVSDLGPHGVYEHISCGAIGTSWLALLSISFGMGGGSLFISLLGRRDFGEHGWLSAPRTDHAAHFYTFPEPAPARAWHHVAFAGDVLLVAAGADGVGVLDLAPVPTPRHALTGHEFREAGRLDAEHERFIEDCHRRLRYVRPADTTGSVVRVQPVAGSRHFLAVVETEAGRDTVVMELP